MNSQGSTVSRIWKCCVVWKRSSFIPILMCGDFCVRRLTPSHTVTMPPALFQFPSADTHTVEPICLIGMSSLFPVTTNLLIRCWYLTVDPDTWVLYDIFIEMKQYWIRCTLKNLKIPLFTIILWCSQSTPVPLVSHNIADTATPFNHPSNFNQLILTFGHTDYFVILLRPIIGLRWAQNGLNPTVISRREQDTDSLCFSSKRVVFPLMDSTHVY